VGFCVVVHPGRIQEQGQGSDVVGRGPPEQEGTQKAVGQIRESWVLSLLPVELGLYEIFRL